MECLIENDTEGVLEIIEGYLYAVNKSQFLKEAEIPRSTAYNVFRRRNPMIIDGNLLFTEFKGALTENYVAQELLAAKHRESHYLASEGSAEVDFLIEDDHEIYPLEVKAGTSQKKKSLLVYNQKYAPSKLYRASTMNLKHDGSIYNYPLYLISRILYSLKGE